MQGLSNHLDRKTENHSNKDIDIERTHLNYDLCEKEGDTLSRMNERLSEVYCMNRKDVKACCEWVVTLPESLKNAASEDQRKFFEETYEFLADRYGGKQNVISANVHNDETTPHLHFDFIPVVWDEKNEREKVSAKELITRTELKCFHNDLDNYLKEKIPDIYQEGILNGKTIGLEDIESLKKYSKEIEQEKQNMAKKLKTFKKPEIVFKNINQEIKNTFLGFGNDVILSKKSYESLEILSKSSIRERQELDNYKKYASKKIEDLENVGKLADQRAEKLEEKNEKLELQVTGLQKHKINEIVFKSMLQDDDRDLNISQTEINGRIILFNLENGHEPKNKDQAESWTSTLEENKRLKTIPLSRLQIGFNKLKEIINKFLDLESPLNAVLRKVARENARTPKSRKKSRGMEL